jgi:hypothetical protein
MRKVFAAVRAIVFLVVLSVSFIPTLFIMASVSIGACIEEALRLVGLPPRRDWVMLAAGIFGYAGLGVAIPVYLGNLLAGWPGAILAPIMVLVGIAILGKW